MIVDLLAGALGIAQGARHALEPDHLTAVTTLASDRPGTRGGFLLGAWWGLGHTVSLLLVGGSVAIVGEALPERWTGFFELLVAVMLIALGIRAVRNAILEGRQGPHHRHTHGAQAHTHAAPPAHLHAGKWTLSTRPLFVGLVHGLAGSGALSALVLARLPDASTRISFIALFGAGSILGMATLTAAIGRPLAQLQKTPLWNERLMVFMGLTSIGMGLFWGARSAAEMLAG